jgi:hypothetical protein
MLFPTTSSVDVVGSTCQLVLLGLVIVVLCTIQTLKRRKQQLPFSDIFDTVPNPHWWTGHLSLIGEDVVEGQRQVCVRYAGGSLGICSFWTFSTPVFTVLELATVHRILKFT